MPIKYASLILLTTVVGAASFAAPTERDHDEASIPKLMKERERILQKLADLAKKRYEQGDSSFDAVVAAERELLDAQLELATTGRQRVAIREAQLGLAKEYEAQVAKLVEVSSVAPVDLMRASVNRLRAEIELLREKQRG